MESNSKLENSFKVKPYPVDLPVRHYGELSKGYDEYLSSVKSGGAVPITLPHGEKVEVTCENIGQLAFLRDGDLSHFILALHTLEDETQVVAVYLLGKWWPVGDVLKTSNKSRRGLVLVESVMERVVLFLLSQVIFGILERPLGEDLYFSVYSMWEHGKILWQNGEAVGFYTVKKNGSLCDSCTGQSYQLPVLDSVFVRSHWRRTGLALQMLEDFCSSQPSEAILGISFPMSPGMYGGMFTITHVQYVCKMSVKDCFIWKASAVTDVSKLKRPIDVLQMSKHSKKNTSCRCKCRRQIDVSVMYVCYPVCKKFLEIHEEERDRLYEVEAPGGWAQRRNVWLNIQLRDFPKHCGNSEQSPQCSYSHERSEANLEEEGILLQCESSVSLKDTSSSGKKRPADQTNTGTNLKKART